MLDWWNSLCLAIVDLLLGWSLNLPSDAALLIAAAISECVRMSFAVDGLPASATFRLSVLLVFRTVVGAAVLFSWSCTMNLLVPSENHVR